MLTCVQGVSREERDRTCRRIKDAFLAAGWAGIITEHQGGEAVVFDEAAIEGVREVEEGRR